MKYAIVLLVFSRLHGISPLHAETAAAERGKRIVYDSLAALGGDKFLAMEDRVEEGRAYSFYRERMTGLAKAKLSTRYLKAAGPGEIGQRERQIFGKDETFYMLFLEDKAYSVTYRGAAPLPKERFQRYYVSTRNNILYILHNRLKEPGLIFESRGTDVWQNTPVDIVDITDAQNHVQTVYFHRTTKLPVRSAWTVRNPATKEKDDFTMLYTKFRDVGGGVMWPFNILSERNGEKVFELFSETVTINNGLTDDLFILDAKVPILDEEK